MNTTNSFFSQSASVLWQTPQDILDLVVKSSGGIDLDPFAGSATQIGKTNYRLPQNGLLLPWNGVVFLNVPFGTSYIREDGICISAKQYSDLIEEHPKAGGDWKKQTLLDFANKTVQEDKSGNCKEIYWLSKSATETKALQMLLSQHAAICHPNKRVNYIDAETGKLKKGATFPSIIIYLGTEPRNFCKAFENFGVCI